MTHKVGPIHKVGPKGQVVIPKALRDQFGIEPGDEVNFWYCDDHLALRPVRLAVESEPLRGRYKGSRLFDDLKAERRAEQQRDELR